VPGSKLQAASVKQQAASYARFKLQAASFKQGWFESFINFQGASGKRQAPSNKHQAASHELQALQYFFLRKVSRYQVSRC
jgi:hypothetical protein